MALTYLGEHRARGRLALPLYLSRLQAGFPSGADDYLDRALDLNEYLVPHPAATFYCRVSGDSMQGAGIFNGDLLVVDRAEPPTDGCVVVAFLDGEFTCKILDRAGGRLLAANPRYPAIHLREGSEMSVEGVVIHSIRTHRPGGASPLPGIPAPDGGG